MPQYFAYGSNMASRLMVESCADQQVIGAARLDGYQLGFRRRSIRTGTGVADLVPNAEGEVWGVLYEVSDACFDQLDLKEGNPWAYRRERVRVICDGQQFDAVTYVVSEPEESEVMPSETYLGSIIEGARERALPHHYIERLESLRA